METIGISICAQLFLKMWYEKLSWYKLLLSPMHLMFLEYLSLTEPTVSDYVVSLSQILEYCNGLDQIKSHDSRPILTVPFNVKPK